MSISPEHQLDSPTDHQRAIEAADTLSRLVKENPESVSKSTTFSILGLVATLSLEKVHRRLDNLSSTLTSQETKT